jgi:hypothetical protein
MSNYTKSTNFATKDNLTPGDPLKIVRGTEIDTEFNNIATAIATKTDNASAAITGGTINDTTIGATTASTGAFTTISATGAITSTLATGTAPLVVASTTKVTNLNVDSLDGADWASPAALGSTTPAAVSATTLSASGNVTLSGGTANGVAYLNGSKVVTSGSALVFDATNTALSVGGAATNTAANRGNISINGTSTAILSLSTGASAKGYVYHSGSDMIINATTGTLALQANGNGALIDSSGNLGLGVTPNAWATSYKAFQIGASSALYAHGAVASVHVTNNSYEDSGGVKYKITGAAADYQQSGGVHYWYNAPSGTAGNAITFTQAMTLDASGNLMVGTTTPTANCKLTVTGAGISIAGGRGSTFALAYPDWSIYNTSSGNALAFDNGTERARIDSSGNLLMGTTSDLGGLGGKVQIASGASRGLVQSINANTRLQEYLVSGSTVGFISTDGTNTTYSTSSDYRLKNTIAPMTGALAKVALLKPCTYKWNADGSDGQGFIAHELAEVVPQCVTGEKDAVNEDGNPQYQGIDTSFLVATLTAALQEAHGLIKNLETRISALEAK